MKKMTRFMSSALVVLMVMMMAVSFAFDGIEGTPQAPGEAATTASNIIGYLRWIGYAIAVGMLVYIGIKYVMASANEKADLKSSLIKYVIGAVLIVGAVTIAGWIFQMNI